MNLEEYIGLPFKQHGRGPEAYDCYGLVRLIYLRELGISLPDYEYGDKDQWHQLWEEANQPRWMRVREPETLDVVLLVAQRNPHIGLYLKGRKLLHVPEHGESCIDLLDSPRWRSRIEGYYRHR